MYYYGYKCIYDKPKVYIPARTQRDEILKEMIAICNACGQIDLDMSMGCEESPNIDLCLTCYEIICQSFEPGDSELEPDQELEPSNVQVLYPNKNNDFKPRNVVKFRSALPYYYHVLNAGKEELIEEILKNNSVRYN